MSVLRLLAADAAAQEALGARLAAALRGHGVIYLQGALGAGKTTFTRGVLHALGHRGAVKSPTYTLVEPYELPGLSVYHFDLYRLTDPQELELMGLRDYCRPDALVLIEWPERGRPLLPPADLVITIRPHTPGRELEFAAQNEYGHSVLSALRG